MYDPAKQPKLRRISSRSGYVLAAVVLILADSVRIATVQIFGNDSNKSRFDSGGNWDF
jgi:hypothetical protein